VSGELREVIFDSGISGSVSSYATFLNKFVTWNQGETSLEGALEGLFDFQSAADDMTDAWDPIPDEMSLGNTLLELRELKGLVAQWKRILSNLGRLKRRRGPYAPGPSNAPIRDASGAFLGHYFGIVPLAQDIVATLLSTDAVLKRLEFLRDTYGREVTLVSRKVMYDPYAPETVPAMSGSGTIALVREHNQIVFTVGCKLYHKLKGLSEVGAWAKATRAYMGLNNPMKIAWNAIPYSFLVDWVYNVGQRLDDAQFPPFEGGYTISSIWHSTKLEGTVGVWHVPQNLAGNAPRRIAGYKVSRYSRRRGLPTTSLRTLTRFKLALLGALVGTHTPDGAYVRYLDD